MKMPKIVATALIISCITPTLVSAAYTSYTSYSLPILQGNNYTTTHNKATNDQNILNKVTALSNASNVTFWAADASQNQISADYKQNAGSGVSTINLTTAKLIGAQVMMGMENYNNQVSVGFVSGEVDFK